ncbi:MAG TPA: PEP/pyruvate-binding domain-containing protein [Candidatus Wallbacteria bacterium]|nr:PEP/pyruvate-binding domain-containing protein [Candidatus Wallbacteria bacterium]
MDNNFIVTLKNRNGSGDIDQVGGKGMNLFALADFGCNVPPFVVVSTGCFSAFVKGLGKKFDDAVKNINTDTPASIARTGQQLRKLFSPEFLDKSAASAIISEVRRNVGADGFLAVRSSATSEDSKDFSYAGQLDSFLFQKTDVQILDSVTKCWASGFSDRAIAYRNIKKIPHGEVKVAVVIQKMINGAVSGVTFTVNPVTQRIDELLINAAYGLGEGLVSGQLNSDQFVCSKDDKPAILRSEITPKKEKIVFDHELGAGTKKTDVENENCEKPCLCNEQVLAVAAVCKKIEKSCGGAPQDIEWTIDAENTRKIYIVQTRPITTLECLRPSSAEYRTIWDNSNIVESYSGVTSPLTFSFALNAYHMVYVQFCEVLKVPREKIVDNDFYFANMLGLLKGRVYYNIKNWCRLISVLPGYNYNRRFMEQMMGVKQKIDFTPAESKHKGFFGKYFIELPQLIWSGANLAWQFLTIEDKTEKFMSIYQKQYDKYQRFEFNKAESHKLVDIYNELENTVLRNWKAPIVNDFMAMIFYGVLRSLIEKWKLDDTGSLSNEIVAGQGNVESTLPLKRLQEIAAFVRDYEDLAKKIKGMTEDELTKIFVGSDCKNYPEPDKKLHEMIRQYLDEFGFRSMNELKLEVPSLMEKPQFIFSILKNYIAAPLKENDDAHLKEREMREKAEREVAEKLGNSRCVFGLFSRSSVFNFVVKYTKKAVAFREYQRFARTKMFGLSRMIFVGIAHNLVKLGVIKDVSDIFFLTREEIFSYVVGTSTFSNLKELINLRRKEYEAYEKSEELPDRVETTGPVYCNDLTISAIIEAPASETDPDLMRGLSCCPGVVRGKVKVILNPSDDMSLNGEILVAARTDPGWVPLYPSASGLLIERGSILSHSAIVARELGLPAIVGITNITKRLKTGDEVEMDGAKGTIRILVRSEESIAKS